MTVASNSLDETDSEATRALQIIESMPGHAWSADAAGRFTYVSPNTLAFLGNAREDLNTFEDQDEFGWRRVVHPDDYDRVAARWRHCLETGDHYDTEHRLRRADGVYRWFRNSGRPSRDAQGRITQWYGTTIDIEDQKRAEAALLDRERELSQLVDMVPCHLWQLTPDGEPIFFNKRMVDFLGLDVADTDKPGMSRLEAVIETVHPDDAAKFRDALSRCLVTGERFSMRYRLRRADGVYCWMSSRAEPMRDQHGRIVQWYGLCHDIDDQMHAEEALRRSERQLQQLIDTVPVQIWCATPSGEPAYINKTMVDYIGLKLEDFDAQGGLPSAIQTIVHPDDRAALLHALTHAYSTGESFELKFRNRRWDGAYRWTEGRADPLRDESGRIIRWYGANVDIHDMVTSQEALERSERQLQQMIDAVPVRAFSTTPTGGPVHFNKRYEDYLRTVIPNFDDLEEPRIAKLVQDLLHPEDAPEVQRSVRHCFETGAPFVMRYRRRDKDGAYRWAEGRMEPLRDQDGAIVQWYGINLDIDDEMRAQEALRDRERELSQLVDMVPSLLWRLTPDGEPNFFNKRLMDFFGLDIADADKPDTSRLAAFIETAVHPDDAASLGEALGRCFATGERFSMKYRLRRADGVYRWVDGRAEPLRDQGGRIVQWYGLSHDIDDQVKAEEALRGLTVTAMALSSCRSLDEVLNTITDRARETIGVHMAVIGTTIDQRWAQAIQAVSLSHKYAAYRDFDAKPDGSGIYATVCDLNRPMRLTQAQLEAHPAWHGYGKYADQHPRLRGWLAVPLIDSNGRNMGLLQLSDKDQGDFTAEDEGIAVQFAHLASLTIGQARLHESLANREQQFRLLVEAIPQHVLTFGRDGSLHYCNQRWMGYTGLTLSTAQAGDWQTAFHPDEARAVLQAWRECCAHGSLYEREMRVRRIDGQYRRFLTRAVPITDSDGSIVQWFWTNTDIEDSKLAAEALHKAQADLARVTRHTTTGELAASIAHEVNQPLAAIVANSHACHRWLSTEPPNIERAKITAERITRDANSAADVVSRIRALFRHAPQARSSEDVNRLISEVCRLMADEIAAKDIRIETKLEQDLPAIALDCVQMQQVFVNLIRNGIEAMDSVVESARALQIRSCRDGLDTIRVEVRDAGMGFKDAERVFEPFFTTKQHGMGMGLAICRSIIESHGGRLWAEKNEPHGATFIFKLRVEAKTAP